MFGIKAESANQKIRANKNMNGYFSIAFAFSQFSPSRTHSSNEAEDCFHVGTGIQQFSPSNDSTYECFKPECSSMCSAASTVVSALCSIEESVSFPSTSETTYYSSRHLTLKPNEQQEPRSRQSDSERGWRRCAYRSTPSERPSLDIFDRTHQAEKFTILDYSLAPRSCTSTAPRQGQPPALEEFSLGSGNPYAACKLSLAAQSNKHLL